MRDQRFPVGIAIFVSALLPCLYCAIQSGPHLYPDTRAYILLGREMAKLAGAGSAHPLPAAIAHISFVESYDEARMHFTVAGSRSPYYSLLLYLSYAIGGMWLVVFLQSLATVVTLWILARNVVSPWRFVGVIAALTAVSSMPVFTEFVMPDFIVPLLIIGSMMLVVRWQSLSMVERCFLAGICVVGSLAHTSAALLSSVLAVLGGGVTLLRFRWGGASRLSRRGLGLVALAGIAGIAGAFLYAQAVRITRHEPLYSPPFVAARIFVDGSGRDYLRHVCPGHEGRLTLCRFREQPAPSVENFLWKKSGVFHDADYRTRVAIISEQARFVIGTIAWAPLRVVGDSIRNSLRLFVRFGSDEALGSRYLMVADPKYSDLQYMLGAGAPCLRAESCTNRISIRIENVLIGSGLLLSVVSIAAILWTDRAARRDWGLTIAFAGIALFLNAAICGPISGPAQRYQSRVMWLVPAMAILLLLDRRALGHGVSNTGNDLCTLSIESKGEVSDTLVPSASDQVEIPARCKIDDLAGHQV